MESIYVLIPIAIVFIIVAVIIFIWAINNGQFDDLESPAYRILFDDDSVEKSDQHPLDGEKDE